MMQKSTLWRHFTELTSEKRVTCLYCPQQLSVANKSTCSLIRHLKKKHPEIKIWLNSSAEGNLQEEVLLVNKYDDADENSETPEESVLDYELIEHLESETEAENNEIDQKPFVKYTAPPKSPKKNFKPEQRVISAMTEARRQIGDALVTMKSVKRQIDSEDEYDHFGHVIASKLRKIQDVDERERVMHSVYNKVYEALMKNI